VVRLKVLTAAGRTFERELAGDAAVIGRSSSADVSIPDRALSRRHARLYRDGDRWLLEDLGSRNGTRVNGELVDRSREVTGDDRIAMGSVTLRLVPDEDAAEVFSRSHATLRSAVELLAEQSTLGGLDDIDHLRRLAERLQILNDVHQALAGPMSLDALLDLMLERVSDILRPEKAAIFLADESGEYGCAAARGVSREEATHLCSRHLVHEVVEKAHAALVDDTLADDRFRQAESLLDAGVRSLAAAPLLGPEGAVGMILVCSRATIRTFTEEDMELLTSLASIAAMRVRNLRLTEAELDRRRLQREVALARKIQVALLPDEVPTIPGFAVHAGNVPSRGVSGDFYKIVSRDGGREVVVMIADVSGKGIGASLLTGALEALSAAPIENGSPPDEVCTTVSRLLLERTPTEKFATVFLGVLEPASGLFRYASAGHTPGILIRRDGTLQSLDSTGVPVGLVPGAAYSAAVTGIEPGDTLVLYTDGITEAENPEGEEYGVERLRELCRRHAGDDPDTLAAGIEAHLDAFARGTPYLDDRTVVILRRE